MHRMFNFQKSLAGKFSIISRFPQQTSRTLITNIAPSIMIESAVHTDTRAKMYSFSHNDTIVDNNTVKVCHFN